MGLQTLMLRNRLFLKNELKMFSELYFEIYVWPLQVKQS